MHIIPVHLRHLLRVLGKVQVQAWMGMEVALASVLESFLGRDLELATALVLESLRQGPGKQQASASASLSSSLCLFSNVEHVFRIHYESSNTNAEQDLLDVISTNVLRTFRLWIWHRDHEWLWRWHRY